MPRPKRAARKRNLTKLFVEKVQPEKSRFLVWDTKQHGLALQVEPTGAKAWKAIYSFHGRPRWLNIGKEKAIGLADARTLAAEAMLAVAKGNDPAAEKKAERGAGTFADLAQRPGEDCRDCRQDLVGEDWCRDLPHQRLDIGAGDGCRL